MTLGKRDTGCGLQVALKGWGTSLVGEFNDNINRPVQASEGWYRYGDSNPGPVAENHVS